MSGFADAVKRIATATLAVAALCALVGFLVGHFAAHSGAANGIGWGMAGGGALIALLTGGSGSPSDNLVHGRTGYFATYWSQSASLPQSPLEVALGSLLVFGGGLALLFLAAY